MEHAEWLLVYVFLAHGFKLRNIVIIRRGELLLVSEVPRTLQSVFFDSEDVHLFMIQRNPINKLKCGALNFGRPFAISIHSITLFHTSIHYLHMWLNL